MDNVKVDVDRQLLKELADVLGVINYSPYKDNLYLKQAIEYLRTYLEK